MQTFLSIESSCDDTSASIIQNHPDPSQRILSNIVSTQLTEHAPYGGVVPEIASRSHINHITPVIKQAMTEANYDYSQLDAIAVTAGPGLIGGVIVGVMTAKALASALSLPLIGVNHLEGHALTPRLCYDTPFPFLMLLMSGGHCQILLAHAVGDYELLGKTRDDALGESFDKVAKMLGLGYPGGPIVEQLALKGDADRFPFPRPLCNDNSCDFSFSGLKTAVLREIEQLVAQGNVSEQDKADICASFQKTARDILQNRLTHALTHFADRYPSATEVVLVGGVAANRYLCSHLRDFLAARDYTLSAPPLALCTDNAAMIGWAAMEHWKIDPHISSPLTLTPKARWNLYR